MKVLVVGMPLGVVEALHCFVVGSHRAMTQRGAEARRIFSSPPTERQPFSGRFREKRGKRNVQKTIYPPMGLIDLFRGELLEIIEWIDDSRDTLAWRFPD